MIFHPKILDRRDVIWIFDNFSSQNQQTRGFFLGFCRFLITKLFIRRIGLEFVMISHPKVCDQRNVIWIFDDFSCENQQEPDVISTLRIG
jgi:hypothetical protein